MEVNLYCYFKTAKVEGQTYRESLTEIRSVVSTALHPLVDALFVRSEFSSLASEPNDLKATFPARDTLLMPFSFQYFDLEKATAILDALKSTMTALAQRLYCEVYFEYHLDDIPY